MEVGRVPLAQECVIGGTAVILDLSAIGVDFVLECAGVDFVLECAGADFVLEYAGVDFVLEWTGVDLALVLDAEALVLYRGICFFMGN